MPSSSIDNCAEIKQNRAARGLRQHEAALLEALQQQVSPTGVMEPFRDRRIGATR